MKITLISAAAALILATQAQAGDCTGFVTGVQPVTRYNHAAGTGFLALRDGPSSGTRQVGELYAGDEIVVWQRSGQWYFVRCMAGRCLDPLWGPAEPSGWAYGRYLSVGGVCP